MAFPALADVRSLVIVHTNDFHGHILEEGEYAGAARIAGLIWQLKKARKDVLAMDAGDAVSGTPVSTLFQGTPIYRIMSSMGYDLGNLGNHEFDYGYDQIRTFKKVAGFPLLGANAFDPGSRLLADSAWKIIKINGIRIGVIGVITPSTPNIIIPQGNEGLIFLAPEKIIQKGIDALQADVDLIIVLSHLGFAGDKQIARSVPGIDLIIGGHSHTRLWPALKIQETWLVQAGRYGTHAGKVEITVDTDNDHIVAFHSTLIPAHDLPAAEPRVQKLVDKWQSQIDTMLDREIAHSPVTLANEALRGLMEQIMTEATGADFGYYNMGGIRDAIPAGKVTARHLWNIEPFGNTLVTMRLTGRQLKHLLLREGEVRADFQALDDDQVFIVATNNFAAAHAQKTFNDILVQDKDLLIRDLLVQAIQRNGLSP